MNNFDAYSLAGAAGAILLLFGFYRTSIGQWTNKSFWYELDNLLGASFLIIYQIHHRAYITMVLNAIWAVVAFRGIASFAERYSGRRKRHTRRRK
jgi:hypothetical protein